MCGIIGYIGKDNFIANARQGLLNLEYRGYDSAGISYFIDSKIESTKSVGNVQKLFDIVPKNVVTHCGIGHTRWATHGMPSTQNCHPHYSQNKRIFVVHNGIIENYQQIKQTFLKKTQFYSQTDTEVIPNLIDYFLSSTGDMLSAINQTMQVLQGSFAIAILNCDQPDKIYFAKHNSPLLIGLGIDENFIASDLLGFNDKVTDYIDIENDCYGYISQKNAKIYKNNAIFEQKIEKIEKSAFSHSRGNYPFYMLKEINDIPLAITETCKIYERKTNPLNQIDKDYFKNIDEIVFVACGTSYHSGLIGEKYIKILSSKKSRSVVASEFIYASEVIDSKTLCVFISQSGETADTLSAIKKAKQMGTKTIGITNVPTSSITRFCDYTLPVLAGTEVAVASTKAYNAQCVTLLIFASFLGNNLQIDTALIDNLKTATNGINIAKNAKNCEKIAKKLKKSKNIYLVGRNCDYITGLEASLKLKEISYIPCEAYPAGELKHGTLALIDTNTPVIAIITEKALISKTMMIINQAKARGGMIYIFTNQNIDMYDTDNCQIFRLTELENELFSPIFSIIPFQLLAYQTTLELGYNPDRPRNLAKSVTVE